MTTDERIKTIRDALLPLDDAWDALNSLVAELDAARAERDAAIDENICLMNAETEALLEACEAMFAYYAMPTDHYAPSNQALAKAWIAITKAKNLRHTERT